MAHFRDRIDAGAQLAERLTFLRDDDVVVLGLPRGGVPVASRVAQELGAPLDVIVVRKLGVPVQPEVAMGAIGEQDARVVDERILQYARIDTETLAAVERRERAILEERAVRFREGRQRVDLTGRTAVIVDDGIATGSTARVACRIARELGASRVVLAAPVAAPQALERIPDADEIVVVSAPPGFMAVGQFYRDFSATSDEEVVELLDAASGRGGSGTAEQTAPGMAPSAGAAPATGVSSGEVRIEVGDGELAGHLVLPAPGAAVVIFAHGSGSSRHSPRNQYVGSVLQEAGLGTLLIDLLTPAEAQDRAKVFDIALLAGRLEAAAAWVHQQPDSASSPIGFFGASTGAGAALRAAAEAGGAIGAVVSRGGRPDLAGGHLGAVTAPTLLIVGGEDATVLELNREAQEQLTAPHQLEVVDGATHLFEEPGTLETAAGLARNWFSRYLPTADHGYLPTADHREPGR